MRVAIGGVLAVVMLVIAIAFFVRADFITGAFSIVLAVGFAVWGYWEYKKLKKK